MKIWNNDMRAKFSYFNYWLPFHTFWNIKFLKFNLIRCSVHCFTCKYIKNCNRKLAHFNEKKKYQPTCDVKFYWGWLKEKAKYIPTSWRRWILYFSFTTAFKYVGGEEEKRKRTDNSKSWYNIKTFAPLKGTKSYTLVCNRNDDNVRYSVMSCIKRWKTIQYQGIE